METASNPFKGYAEKSTAIYIAGELIDLATTYILSPDLALETNALVRWLGFGWTQLVMLSIVASMVMLLTQRWIWRRLFTQMPDHPVPYMFLYHALIFGNSAKPPSLRPRSYSAGTLMGVAFVVAYALIASKLMTCAWNLTLLINPETTHSLLLMVLTKNTLAAGFGLAMFYIYPFFLNQALPKKNL